MNVVSTPIPESEAISWPECLDLLRRRLAASAEEISIWIGNNRIQAYSLRPYHGVHAAETVPFLDEPHTPVYNLLDRFKYSRAEIESFNPERKPNPGSVEKLSVAWGKMGWRTAFHNPSGRYLSFEAAVEFLCGLPGLAPTRPEEVESAVRREMQPKEIEDRRIMPLRPFGIGISEPDQIGDAWFSEGSILMLAMEQWGAEIDLWNDASRHIQLSAHGQDTCAPQSPQGGRSPTRDEQRLIVFKEFLLEYAKEHCSKQVKEGCETHAPETWTLECFAQPVELPLGAKVELRQRCHQHSPVLFTLGKDGETPKNGTFDKFWKTGNRKQLCRLGDEDRFKS